MFWKADITILPITACRGWTLPNTNKPNPAILKANNSFAWTPETAEKVDSRLRTDHTSGHTHGQRHGNPPLQTSSRPSHARCDQSSRSRGADPALGWLESCAFALRSQRKSFRLKLHIPKGFRLGLFSSKKHSHFVVESFCQPKHAIHTHRAHPTPPPHAFRGKSSFCATPCLPISNF